MKNGVFCPLSDSGRGCPFFAHCGRVFWCVGGVGVVVWESGRACVSIGLPNSRKRATAHGLRVSVCLRLRLPSVSLSALFVRPSNIIFLALIISAYSRGVFYSTNGNEKRRTVCVGSITLPQPLSRTPNYNPRMIVSETFPIVGENLET